MHQARESPSAGVSRVQRSAEDPWHAIRAAANDCRGGRHSLSCRGHAARPVRGRPCGVRPLEVPQRHPDRRHASLQDPHSDVQGPRLPLRLPLYNDFVLGLEESISEAEKRAGCVPDPTPRRLSKAEQERKRIREQSLSSHKTRSQQDDERNNQLHLDWSSSADNGILTNSGTTVLTHPASSNTAVEERTSDTPDNNKPKGVRTSSKRSKVQEAQGSQGIPQGGMAAESASDKRVKSSKSDKVSSSRKCNVISNVRRNVARNVTKPVRKLREYNEISEILEDIKSGGVSPYESVEEIIEDCKKGKISKVEAMMFTAALDIYKPEEKYHVDDDIDDLDDDDSEGYDDGYGDDDDEDDREPEDNYDRWADWTSDDD